MTASQLFGTSGIAYVVSGSSIATLVLAATVVLLAAFGLAVRRVKQKYPAGPSRLDFIRGYVLNAPHILEYKNKWRQRFGPIYSLFNDKRTFVTLADYDLIHDAFVRRADVCSSRPEGSGAMVGGANIGVINSPQYKELRRFALTVLRDQGMGKVDMELKILEEVSPFIDEIETNMHEPMDMSGYTQRAVSNIICNLILGSRFEYNDPVFVSLLNRFITHMKRAVPMSTIYVMPFLKMLPGDIFGYHRYVREIERNKSYFREAIQKHKETLDPEHPRDFIDAYLLEMKANEGTATADASPFNENNCIATLVQLFIAGTDTTANTLLWAWLYMILHKDVQKKVQSEIDARIGSLQPSMRDKAQMPYTEAVLTEVLRLANTAPDTLPHQADETVNIGNHVIPAGTRIIGSLYDVHVDEKVYPDPLAFKPERFIGSNGSFEKPKKLIPFGIGSRVCLSESLARAELFLFFTSVLQKFDLDAPAGSHYKAEGVCEPIHRPHSYKILFKRRQVAIKI